MKEQDYDLQLNNGEQLFAREWLPETESKGVICLVHGLGEHSGRYSRLAQTIANAGYAVMCYDQRGHGQSLGRRGHTPSYDRLLDDLDSFLRDAQQRFSNRPVFLYGHSLGGNLVLNYCLRRQPELTGVIATSAWLRLTSEPSRLTKLVAAILSRFWPAFSLPNGLDIQALSHDFNVTEAYKHDPLVHNRLSVKLFTTVSEAGLWALENASRFNLPLLLMHGGADRITSPEATARFAAKIEQKCTVKIWPELYHELHNEPENQEILTYLINWALSRGITNQATR